MAYDFQLNDVQKQAVIDTEGAVLVIAGAGSGKTRVLTARVCHLVSMGVNPYNILAITFTNKAANEMKERISNSLSSACYVWTSTFHSMCAKILRFDTEKLGYDSNFSIYTELESERVVKRIADTIQGADPKKKSDYANYISSAKTAAMSPQEYYAEVKDFYKDAKICFQIHERYEEELRRSNAMDFDDLLLKTVELFETCPDVLEKYQDRFHYICVDEFQDTNTLQYRLVKLLSGKWGNVFVVGDEDQSIYSWRGAEIKNILGFPKDFPNARVYKLEQNYRSTTAILNAANNVIKNNSARNSKNLWSDITDGGGVDYYEAYSDRDEAQYVTRQINWLVNRGATYKDIAVLVRANSLTRLFEEDFNLHGIPYKVFGGFKFFERKEIKDTLAYIRLALNPSDNDSLLRIINYPSRKIGPKTVEELKFVAETNNMTLYSVLINPGFLSPSTAKKLEGFLDIAIDINANCHRTSPVDFMKYVIKRSGIEDALTVSDNKDDRNTLENVQELVGAVENFIHDNPEGTIDDFMQSVALVADTDEMNNDDYVTIATVHAVKGLEFENVFIIGLEEGIFPVNRAIVNGDIEEERRLMYVAITRAKRRLFVINARDRFRFGERIFAPRSRFVTEMLGGKVSVRATSGTYQKNGDAQSRYGANRQSGYGYAKDDGTPQASKPTYSKIQPTGQNCDGSTESLVGFDKTAVLGNNPRSVVNTAGVDYDLYQRNTVVEHSKFGRGLIISTIGEGADKTAAIAFQGLGVKRFALAVAAPNLRIVKE